MAGRNPNLPAPTKEDGSLAFPFFMDGPEHLQDFLDSSRGGEWAVYFRGKAFSLERMRQRGARMMDINSRARMIRTAYEFGRAIPFQRRSKDRPDVIEYLVYTRRRNRNVRIHTRRSRPH